MATKDRELKKETKTTTPEGDPVETAPEPDAIKRMAPVERKTDVIAEKRGIKPSAPSTVVPPSKKQE